MNVQSNPKQLKWTHVNPELVQVILLSFAVGDASPRYAAATKSLQSCLTLCDPIDGLLPGSSVPGILQARTLEWVAIAFSNAWKGKVKVKSLSCVQLLATSWPAAHQAPPSMGSSRQEYWSGVPLPSLSPRYRPKWDWGYWWVGGMVNWINIDKMPTMIQAVRV